MVPKCIDPRQFSFLEEILCQIKLHLSNECMLGRNELVLESSSFEWGKRETAPSD